MTAILSNLIPVIGWALLQFVWQGLVIGIGAAFVLWLLRDARPQARYAVACTALALCLLVPVLGIVGALLATTTAASPAFDPATPLAAMTRIAGDAAPLMSWQVRLDAQLPWLVALWAIGAGLLSLRMALGLAWVQRVGRASPDIVDALWQARLTQLAARMGLTRHVSLRVADALDTPVAAGWWRPMVLVPAALLARMPPDLLEALLAHELAHIRRHDYLVNLMQSAVEALLFYHPVTWWLSKRIRVEREHVADDLAARALGEPRRLALALQELDRFQFAHQQLALAANGGHLMSRIQRLIRPDGRALNWHTLTWRMAIPILGLTVACVTVYAQGTTPAPKAAASTTASIAPVAATPVAMVAAAPAASPTPTPFVEATPAADAVAMVAPVAPAIPATPTVARVAPAAHVTAVPVTFNVTPTVPVTATVAVTPIVRVTPTVAPTPAVRVTPQVDTVERVGITPRPHSIQVNTGGPGDGYALVHAGDEAMNFSGNTRDLAEVKKLRAKVGGDFLWFRRGGKSYVIRDPALVAKADAAWKPMEPISAKMEVLSKQMEVHSKKMETLSQKMEATSGNGAPIGVEMDRLSRKMDAISEQQDALSRHTERLGEKMQAANSDEERRALDVEMRKLTAQMQPLSVQMNQLSVQMSAQSQRMQATHQPMESLSREMELAAKPMQALGEQMGALGKQQEKLSLEADRQVKALIDQAARNGQAQPAGSAAPR